MANVHRYNSVAEAVRHYQSFVEAPESSENDEWFDAWHQDGRDEWAGGSHDDAMQWAERGNSEHGDQIREAIASLGHVAMPNREQWNAAPVGFLPNVPAYVSGSPNSMWRRTMGEQPRPVRVFVSGFTSWVVKHKHIVERGAAITALIDYLKSRAPVELYLYCPTGGNGIHSDTVTVIRLQSETLDPDVAGFLFCSAARTRRFTGPLNAALGGSTDGHPYRGDISKVLGITERDILISDMRGDSNHEGVYTPEWVRRIAEAALKG